jgi:hypothetical protein
MSMKKSSDIIGNRVRDLSVCSAVPQPLRHRVPPPPTEQILIKFYIKLFLEKFIKKINILLIPDKNKEYFA